MPTNSPKSRRVWKHNSFSGHVAMGKAHMNAIIRSDTTSVEAKETAFLILKLQEKLKTELKVRVDAQPN